MELKGNTIPSAVNTEKKTVPVLSESAFITSNNQTVGNRDNEFREKFLKTILDQSKDYPLPEAVVSIVQNLEVFAFLTLKSF